MPLLPLFATAFAGLWLALVANLAATVGATVGTPHGPADRLVVLVALYGFLVPISVAMGARLFPLHFAAQLPHTRLLLVGLGLLVTGLALRAAGELADLTTATAAGLAGTALAIGTFVVGTRVFAPRRAVPGERTPWYADPAQWHGLSAFAWLGVDAALLMVSAAALLWPELGPTPLDAEVHLVGAGFVTLLILGEGARLLPGFAGRPLRSDGLVWATLALGNLAAALRTAPLLLPPLFPGSGVAVALAGSGLAGVLAVALFALNLAGPHRATARRDPT